MALVTSGLTIPPADAINRTAAPRRLAAAALRSVVPLVYGQDRITALVLNVLAHGSNADIVLVQLLWAHQGDSVNDVRLNDEALPGGASITNYDGSQSTVDSTLAAAFSAQGITYTDTLAGYMYSVLQLPVREFTGELNVSARIRGRKLYDPRLDSTVSGGSGTHRVDTPSTWAWSDNPSLALADFLYRGSYGCGEAVDWVSVQAAANANDVLLSGAKKRLIGAAFTQPVSAQAMADTLRTYAACWLVPTGSGIKLLADADAAAVATYAHASGAIASLEALTRRDLGNAPTAVEVIYTDTSVIPWRDASVTVSLSGAGTTRPWRLSSVRLPGIHRYAQAKREATERLNKFNLNDLSCTLEVFDIGIRHEIGDIVNITHPLGPTDKPMRIADAPEMPAPGRWRLPLVEHDPAAYSSLVESEPTYADTGRVVQPGPPPSVTGLAYAFVSGAIRLTWDEPTIRDYRSTHLRIGASWAAGTKLDGTAGSTIATGGQFDWRWPAAGTYTVRAKHVDRSGQLSTTEATLSITVRDADVALSMGSGNLLRNSSFEVDTNATTRPDYWTSTSGTSGLTITWSQSTTAYHGKYSLMIDVTAISTPTAGTIHGTFQDLDATILPKVTPGVVYALSGYFRPSTTAYQPRLVCQWLDGSLATVGTSMAYTAPSVTANVWQRVFADPMEAPSGAVYARVFVGFVRPSTSDTTLGNMRIDAVMLQEGRHVTGYWPNDATTGDLLPGSAMEVVSAYDEVESLSTTIAAGGSAGITVCPVYWENNSARSTQVYVETFAEGELQVTAGSSGFLTAFNHLTITLSTGSPPAGFDDSVVMRNATLAGGKITWNYAFGGVLTIPPGESLSLQMDLELQSNSSITLTYTAACRRTHVRVLALKAA